MSAARLQRLAAAHALRARGRRMDTRRAGGIIPTLPKQLMPRERLIPLPDLRSWANGDTRPYTLHTGTEAP